MKDSKTQYLQIKQFKKNEDTCSETEFCVLPMDGGAGYKGFLCYLSCVDSDDMKALSSADGGQGVLPEIVREIDRSCLV